MLELIVIIVLSITVMDLFLVAIYLRHKCTTEKRKCNKEIKDLRNEIEQLYIDNNELRHLRKQEVHNNTILTDKNRELQAFRYEVEDIINGKRTSEEKEAKIKELLYKDSNSN